MALIFVIMLLSMTAGMQYMQGRDARKRGPKYARRCFVATSVLLVLALAGGVLLASK